MLTNLLPLALLLVVSASPLSVRQSTIVDCLTSANLVPITSASTAYSGDIAAYNQRLQPLPAAVVYPTTARDVSSAILCAASAEVPVSARSGGHSYASYGLGGTDGALVVDLGAFTEISLSGATAKVGGGNRLGDIALELNDHGRGLPHGTCPFVGVGGHAAYGGFGLAGRLSGLLVDRIQAFDVVLANGTILTNFTAQDDPDLFWGLQGAAPNFGLVTSFYFTTFPVPPVATSFEYSYYGMEAAPAAKLFSAWQAWGYQSAPAELGTTLTVGAGGSIEIMGVYYGSLDDFHDVFDPFVDTNLPPGYSQNVTELSWIESLQALAGDQGLNTSTASDTRDDFLAKSLMTPTSTPIRDDVLLSFFTYLFNTTTVTEWFVEVDLYGGANSVINELSLAVNSFGHRDKLLTFQMYASSPDYAPPYPEEGFSFLDEMYNAIVSPMSDAWGSDYGAYVNYVDPSLSADEVKTLYWASQYDRLSSLRGKYDPGAVFKNPQSIVAA